MSEAYNPLDMENLGKSVLGAILSQPTAPLGDVPVFMGAGVYAIYYTGTFPCYARLAEVNRDERFSMPIYVGKAVPSGGRRGVSVVTTTATTALRSRLIEHSKSVDAATNLALEDFWVRWLVVEPIWIPLGESLLISRFGAVWNALIDGFGNHDPGKGRREGMRSRWDTLHPGRPWVSGFPGRNETPADIQQDVTQYLAARIPHLPSGGGFQGP